MRFINRKISFLLFFILMVVNSFAYINISPTTLDKNILKGAYEEYTFYNNTTVPLRYKLSVIPMEENKNVKDMSKWVEVYPKVVTVNPTEQKSFKLYIQAPKGTEAGDYGAFVNIRQVSAPKLESGEQKDIAAGMAVMVNVNMGLYGYIGDEVPKIETTKPQIIKDSKDNQILKMVISNKTNRLVRMKIEVKSKKNYIYKVGETRAMRGQNLELENVILDMNSKEIGKEVIITDVETEKVIKKVSL